MSCEGWPWLQRRKPQFLMDVDGVECPSGYLCQLTEGPTETLPDSAIGVTPGYTSCVPHSRDMQLMQEMCCLAFWHAGIVFHRSRKLYSNVMALNPRVFLHISFSNQLTSTGLESALGRQWNPNLWQMILEERRLCEKMLERPLRVGFEHVGTNPYVCPHPSNMCKQYHILVTWGWWTKTLAIHRDYGFRFQDSGF